MCVSVVSICGTVWALDEAVLTPTPERSAKSLSAEVQKQDQADAEKEFSAAMSVWFKHRYREGEKLLGEFARKNPNSRWRTSPYCILAGAVAGLAGCLPDWIGKEVTKPIEDWIGGVIGGVVGNLGGQVCGELSK